MSSSGDANFNLSTGNHGDSKSSKGTKGTEGNHLSSTQNDFLDQILQDSEGSEEIKIESSSDKSFPEKSKYLIKDPEESVYFSENDSKKEDKKFSGSNNSKSSSGSNDSK